MSSLVINGTDRDDTIVITATGTDSGSYSINGGEAIAFSGLTSLTITGGAGNDTLTIVNPDGGLLAPAGGIAYDGGGDPADALEVLGGTATEAIYTAGATPDAGTLAYVGAAGRQTIQFAGIAPMVDTVAAANLFINGTGGADAITVTDGGLLGGVPTTVVSAPTFESIQFANKTNVQINGFGGGDTVVFNNPNPAAFLTSFSVVNVVTIGQSGPLNYSSFSFNTTTVPAVYSLAVGCLGSEGVAGFVTRPRGDWMAPLAPMLAQGQSLKGILGGSATPQLFIPLMIDYWRQGRFPFDRLVTTFDFENIGQAWAECAAGSAIKPVLMMERA